MLSDSQPKFFNPYLGIEKTANKLPHWQQPGATYFITFRLADAVPASLRAGWEQERSAWLTHHPKPWTPKVELEYHQRFSQQMERWLDAGHGSCVLAEGSVRGIVEECLRHFDLVRYDHHAWVIMPNHVHLLTSLHPDWHLEQVLHTWKSFTAHRIHKQRGTEGRFWQEDYFDRLIRDGEHFANCVRYIRNNPVKAKLSESRFTHYESSLVIEAPRGEGRPAPSINPPS